MATPTVPLPRAWPEHAKRAALQAVGLPHFVLTHVRGWCLDSRIARVRLAAERDIAVCKLVALEEEARILRSRLEHVAAQRRPHYPPTSRLAILVLRAARGWTVAETARRFQLSEQTLQNWMRRLDEEGEAALVRMPEPVNRFPDFVHQIVSMLGRTFPALGKVRIAQLLARAGLHLAASTVARMRRKKKTPPSPPSRDDDRSGTSRPRRGRTVTARYPHHVWNIDLTLLPLVSGFWVPWIPEALVQRWPFCFWLAAVIDHHSRAVVATRLFFAQPSARDVTRLLDLARRRSRATPKYIVSDRGAQFQTEYRAWCARRGVRARFGAVGKSGSIAIIERFFRSLKEEMLRRLPLVPMKMGAMAREVEAYVVWYNEHRPHQGLAGRTPVEVRDGKKSVKRGPVWETRPRYPIRTVRVRGDPTAMRRMRSLKGSLVLRLDRVAGRAYLPVVALRHVARSRHGCAPRNRALKARVYLEHDGGATRGVVERIARPTMANLVLLTLDHDSSLCVSEPRIPTRFSQKQSMNQYSYHEGRARHDASRDRRLEQLGWRVLRVTDDDVIGNLDGVVERIARTASAR